MPKFNLLPILFQISQNSSMPENVFNAMQQHLSLKDAELMKQFMQDSDNAKFLLRYLGNDRAINFFNEVSLVVADNAIALVDKDLQEKVEHVQSILEIRQSLLTSCLIIINNIDNPELITKAAANAYNYIDKIALRFKDEPKIEEIKNAIISIQNFGSDLDCSKIVHAVVQICGSLMRNKIYPLCDKYFDYSNHEKIQKYFNDNPGFYIIYFAANSERLDKFLSLASSKTKQLLFNRAVNYIENREADVPAHDFDEVVNVLVMLRKLLEAKDTQFFEANPKHVWLAIMHLNAKISNEFVVQQAIEPLILYLIEKIDDINLVDNDNKRLLNYITSLNSIEFVSSMLDSSANLLTPGVISRLIFIGKSKFIPTIVRYLEEKVFRNDAIVRLREELLFVNASSFNNNPADAMDVILELVKIMQNNFAFEDFSQILLELTAVENLPQRFEVTFFNALNIQSFFKTFNRLLKDKTETNISILKRVCWYAFNNTLSDVFYSNLWCYLASNSDASYLLLDCSIADESHLRELMDVRNRARSAQNNPFELAISHNNIAFLQLVSILFGYLNNREFKNVVGQTASRMLTDVDSIVRMNPYIEYLKARRAAKDQFATEILQAIDDKIAILQPPQLSCGCFPTFSMSYSRKKNTMG